MTLSLDSVNAFRSVVITDDTSQPLPSEDEITFIFVWLTTLWCFTCSKIWMRRYFRSVSAADVVDPLRTNQKQGYVTPVHKGDSSSVPGNKDTGKSGDPAIVLLF